MNDLQEALAAFGKIGTNEPVVTTTGEPEDEIDAMFARLSQALQKENSLEGKDIVVTGKLQNYSRQGIVNAIMSKGGTSPSAVTKNTVALVVGERPGMVKIKAAVKRGIPMIDEDQLMTMLTSDYS